VATSGSTYSKSGNLLLIDKGGESSGLLSGGCLEEDLARRAAKVLASGEPDVFSYDLTSDDDVFGLGVGCEGVMDILLQPLDPAANHEPLGSVIAGFDDRRFAVLETGAEHLRTELRVSRPRRVLLLGAGRDVPPLVGFCRELGWNVAVSDHRPRYVEMVRESHPHKVTCAPAEELGAGFELDQFDAAVIMSHHLASDRHYLVRIAESAIPFVGLIGPPHRRDRLLGEIGTRADALAGRLRGPVGKPIGGRGPAAIALEVAAELQAYFCELNEAR
jgi:xanthine/CO dehydrogenase XdhC/CoxF family maturation factor